MYIILSVLVICLFLFLVVFHCKKKKIIHRLCCMSMSEKSSRLNELAKPLGYEYDAVQEVFTSRTDAWQKKYGYGRIYDRLAPYMDMIFDCQPVYFDYSGKTWLIEFWKGQYGINIGSEAGVYHADTILPPDMRKHALFRAADENEYLDISTALYDRGRFVAERDAPHWWLTIFSVGRFAGPEDLTLKVSLRFPDFEMRDAFCRALRETNCAADEIYLPVYSPDVSFTFCGGRRPCLIKRVFRQLILFKIRLFCRLYRFVTRPFSDTCDKLLYLYYYLPFAFRRLLRLKRCKRRGY